MKKDNDMDILVGTNLPGLETVRREGVCLSVVRHADGAESLAARLRSYLRLLACDYILINCAPRELLRFCLLKLMLPHKRCRLVALDTVLPVPSRRSLRDRLALRVKVALFRQVSLFIEYFKDTRGYEEHFGIPREKFRYVPFKINRYEKVLETRTRDDGYVFCGGNTRRDFRTLIEAARRLPYPFRIVTMDDSVIRRHGSVLDVQSLPPNIEVVRHDGSDSFLEHIAASRLVALPIVKDTISASGIGVYLACMALGKCVIISEGPAVSGVVPPGAAIIVPPEEPEALRAAVERAWTDDVTREQVAAAGRRYALALGGHQRLCESVVDVLIAERGATVVPQPRYAST